MAVSARRRKAREIKRGAIIKAARSLFLAKGFSDVTVDAIAKKVDISKGAFYLHFKSKDEIYVSVLSSEIERFCRTTSEIQLSPDSAKSAMKELAAAYVDFFLDEPEIFRIFISFMLFIDKKSKHHEQLYKLVEQARRAIKLVEDIIDKGIASGEFSSSLDRQLLLNAIWGLLNGIINLYIFVARRDEHREKIKKTVSCGLDAILAGISA
ncbi:MAG: TetR/AcrR family transcriptional regulator [Deltaproteobacteria bacterium]|nr:TetR/AcrR family transcriptional regulator [Deltaproteobacteria bacterium]